jgi:hypothetical protein
VADPYEALIRMSPTRLTPFRIARALLLASVALGAAACADDPSPGASLRASAGNEPGSAAAALLRGARGARDSGDLANAVMLYKNAYELAPGRADIAAETNMIIISSNRPTTTMTMMGKA